MYISATRTARQYISRPARQLLKLPECGHDVVDPPRISERSDRRMPDHRDQLHHLRCGGKERAMNAYRKICTDADLLNALVEHDRYMLDAGYESPDDKSLEPKAAANWRRMREAVANYSSASVARHRGLSAACAN